MKIAVASLGDPCSIETWSGIPASIISGLRKKGHEIKPINLIRPAEPWHYSWLRRYYHRTHHKWFMASVEAEILKAISAQLDLEVNRIKPAAVLVIHGDWLAYATFDYPAFIIHDTTFASIVNYYSSFTNLSDRSLMMGNQMYQKALNKSVAAIFSARWASDSAVTHYRLPESKVFTIPFGANIFQTPTDNEVNGWIRSRSDGDVCNFVFIGTQWDRKGGPDTLRFVAALDKLGIKCRLTIVGCDPIIPLQLQKIVELAGFINKSERSENARLHRILRESHALIVLSKAECYGCVYCEANAYGLPALGRDTGGVSEIIRDGVNGLLLTSAETIESFAERWSVIWRDRTAYRTLAANAYHEFKRRLNYDVFTDKLEDVMRTSLGNHSR